VKEFDVNLAPDNFRRTDTVEVRSDVFQGGDPAPIVETNLVGSEIKEASTVLADDPFRAVQSLPGVSARADKCWAFTRWKITLYGEVLNLTNHKNEILLSEQVLPTGQAIPITQQALPITPTTGLAFEF